MAVSIGAAPWNRTRSTIIRSVKSPSDRSTVVSILPKFIDEEKATIFPRVFQLPPGSPENPSCLVVGPSSWFKSFANDQPSIEIVCSSTEIAESIVRDYCNGLPGCDMDGAVPGIFFVDGDVSAAEVKLKYKSKLAEMKAKQERWFLNLVGLADSSWARSINNPLAISDEMRLAARMLNLNEKPWLKDFNIIQKVRCMACGSMKEAEYPVCPMCKAIDPNHPEASKLKFAV